MDYKQKYNEIPNGYKKDVLTISGCFKSDIHFWINTVPGKVGIGKRKRVENAIDKVWTPHNFIKSMSVEIEDEHILVNKEPVRYCDLTTFKIQLTGTIGDYKNEYDAISNGKSDIIKEYTKDPYAIELLIAKYITHDK